MIKNMKNLNLKSKIYLILQILFAILTFVGFVLLLVGKINNVGMSIVCMVFSLTFGNFYKDSKKETKKIK